MEAMPCCVGEWTLHPTMDSTCPGCLGYLCRMPGVLCLGGTWLSWADWTAMYLPRKPCRYLRWATPAPAGRDT